MKTLVHCSIERMM